MSRQQIDLPPHVYTRQNLAESGIRFPPPVLDTAARNGPSLTARITAVLAVLTMGISCYAGFSEGAVTVLRIAGFLLCLDAAFRFIRWIRHIRIRQKLLASGHGVPVEPLALVLKGNPEEVPAQLSKVRSIIAGSVPEVAVVYKETGTQKPRFYITPYRRSKDFQMPSGTAMLYRHHSREHYYALEDDFDFIRNRSRERLFSGTVSSAEC